MNDPTRVRVSGPLEPFAAGFAAWLSGQGYPPSSAARQLHLVAHLSRWLAAEARDLRELNDEVVEAFVVSRRACGYSGHRTSRALVGLLGYLRDVGVVPVAAEPAPEGPVEGLLCATGGTWWLSGVLACRPSVAMSVRSGRFLTAGSPSMVWTSTLSICARGMLWRSWSRVVLRSRRARRS